MTFRLHDWQGEIVTKFSTPELSGGVLGLGVGSGKTGIAVAIAKARNAKRVIICAPSETIDGWHNHIKWLTGEDMRPCANQAIQYRITPDPSKRDERESIKFSKAEAQASLEAAMRGDDGWFFITRELFQRVNWVKKDHPKGLIDVKTQKVKVMNLRNKAWAKTFDVIIYDECQMASDQHSRSADTLKGASAKFKLLQSADWFGNRIENMLTIAKIVWPERYTMTKARFIDEYLNTKFDPFSYDKKAITGEVWPGQFASTFPAYVAAPPTFAQPTPAEYAVDMVPAQARMYRQMQKNMIAELESGDVVVVDYKMHLHTRLRELALGVFDLDENEQIVFRPGAPSAKLDAAKRIMAEYKGEQFILFTHSEKFARKAAIDLGAEAWTGKVSKTERDAIKSRFLSGETRVIVATEAISEGVSDLQFTCRNMIRLSLSYNELKNRQVIGRIARQGQGQQVNVWDIAARGTVDEGILPKLDETRMRNNAAKGLR